MKRATNPFPRHRPTRARGCLASVLTMAGLAGCATHPGPQAPVVDAPAAWSSSTVHASEPQLAPDWWTLFDDPVLDALEARAVAANADLQIAIARLDEARALARLSHAEASPQLAVSNGHALTRSSENAAGSPQVAPGRHEQHHAGFDLGYEIDLWGRLRHANDAARAEADAVAADVRSVLLALTADVARHYHEVRSLDAEIAVIEATIALRRDAVHLQESRAAAGLINETDVARARSELAGVEADLHATRRQRSRLEHALAVLCGEAAPQFALAPAPAMDASWPAVPAGLPSSLLQRRPDIAAAAARVEADASGIASAHAALFPSVSLTGAAGVVSGDLSSLLESGSRAWSIGSVVHLPILDGSASRANLEAAEARYAQSAAAYRDVVLRAFREVEDALSDLHTLALQGEAVGRALAAARDTASLAHERYQRGLSSYLEVVDAQRVALQAEREDAALRGERATATVRLVKALGGGWNG